MFHSNRYATARYMSKTPARPTDAENATARSIAAVRERIAKVASIQKQLATDIGRRLAKPRTTRDLIRFARGIRG